MIHDAYTEPKRCILKHDRAIIGHILKDASERGHSVPGLIQSQSDAQSTVVYRALIMTEQSACNQPANSPISCLSFILFGGGELGFR